MWKRGCGVRDVMQNLVGPEMSSDEGTTTSWDSEWAGGLGRLERNWGGRDVWSGLTPGLPSVEDTEMTPTFLAWLRFCE